MKVKTKQRCIAIRESDPEDFEMRYVKALDGVRNPDIFKDYRDGYFIAIATWKEEVEEVETVRDEFNLEGIRYLCGDCPYLERDDDRRRKRYPCKYAEYGTARIDSEACELFYKRVKQGLLEV